MGSLNWVGRPGSHTKSLAQQMLLLAATFIPCLHALARAHLQNSVYGIRHFLFEDNYMRIPGVMDSDIYSMKVAG